MAKALLGHLGGPDPRLVDELRRLRRRVVDLETEVGRLLAEREFLSDTSFDRPVVDAEEPAAAIDELADRRARAVVLS